MENRTTPKTGLEIPAINSLSSEEHHAEPAVLFDVDNPRSVIRIIPENMAKVVSDMLYDLQNQDLFALDEWGLRERIKDDPRKLTITPTDNRLRLRFWLEYEHCQATGAAKMDWRRIVAGICTYENFFRVFLKQPHKVAWLLCPPTGYVTKTNEALEFGLEQLREILAAPSGAGGKIDVKLGELKLKIVALLDTRVKGAPLQKNMNIVANLSGPAAAAAAQRAVTGDSMEKLERKLMELEKKEQAMLNGGSTAPVTIDITKAK